MKTPKISKGKIAIILIVGLFVALIGGAFYLKECFGDLWHKFTGFEGKQLWDWLDLLIIPLLLAALAIMFNLYEKNKDRSTEELERQKASEKYAETTLQNYLEKMSELLLTERLLEKKADPNDPVVAVARTITVTALRRLDKERRNILLQFLRDAKLSDFLLVNAHLRDADLTNALFHDFNLTHADLSGANLSQANLLKTKLAKSMLIGAKFKDAILGLKYEDYIPVMDTTDFAVDFTDSILAHCDFTNATLTKVNMTGANISGAIFDGADLTRANLYGVNDYSDEQFTKAASLKLAIMPDGTSHS